MYHPPYFREQRQEVMHDLIRAHPLATLVTYGSEGLTANHIPMVLHGDADSPGILRGHIARANPLWNDFDKSIEALAVFQGPHHYVTPSWYPSKKEHGKVVPTWNYAVVHAHGLLRVMDDADWLLEQVHTLTSQHETGREQAWAVSDAPPDYVEKMLKAIVGLELPISRLEGKWKLSQNRSEQDREGVARGLEKEATESSLNLADLMQS